MTIDRKFGSIYWKFLAILIPALTLVALLFDVVYTYTKTVSDEKELKNKVETISEIHGLAVSYPLQSHDREALSHNLQAILLHPEVLCVDVRGLGAKARYQWPLDCTTSSDNDNVVSSELTYDKQIAGYMNLYYTSLPQQKALWRETLTGAVFSLLQIICVTLAAYLALRYIVGRPINRLIRAIQKAERSDEWESVYWHGQDELGDVISAYNELINKIEDNTRDLIAAQEQAETVSRTNNRFLANMSHELRTPLTTVIGITEMLREEAEEGHSDTEPYDRVAMSGRHLLQLIDDLLDMSKLDAGKIGISIETTELELLLAQVCATVQPMATNQNNRVKLRYSGRPEFIDTDPLRLKQILINLLSNACKFTKNGDIVLEVNEQIIAGKKVACFCVRDTGIGIPEDKHDRLFAEFFQVNSSTVRQYGGAGLGLTISQRLCDLLGGEISIRSTLGQGSAFSFVLSVESHLRNARPLKSDSPAALEIDLV